MKWGFIDDAGHMVIAPQFDATRRFDEGLAPACVGDAASRKCGYIAR